MYHFVEIKRDFFVYDSTMQRLLQLELVFGELSKGSFVLSDIEQETQYIAKSLDQFLEEMKNIN